MRKKQQGNETLNIFLALIACCRKHDYYEAAHVQLFQRKNHKKVTLLLKELTAISKAAKTTVGILWLTFIRQIPAFIIVENKYFESQRNIKSIQSS